MGRTEFLLKMAALWTVFAALVIATLAFVASFTVIPMHRNYAQCGTIFLCAGDR